jgi:hypothetical protein
MTLRELALAVRRERVRREGGDYLIAREHLDALLVEILDEQPQEASGESQLVQQAKPGDEAAILAVAKVMSEETCLSMRECERRSRLFVAVYEASRPREIDQPTIERAAKAIRDEWSRLGGSPTIEIYSRALARVALKSGRESDAQDSNTVEEGKA